MSTLYRPVLIETAEQAEALPEGSLVRDVRSGFDYRARHALGGYLQADLDAGVDVEALVPIEAEEEITRAWDSRKINSRLVTPWESA
ncbi:hypothetical protein ACTXJ1_10220 [Brachybacterium alimentarium]|uniref:hypothetical protein n=1 Tax=Brachybacterium alimentarium TaxID=47845 RepID=UPI003FD06C0C